MCALQIGALIYCCFSRWGCCIIPAVRRTTMSNLLSREGSAVQVVAGPAEATTLNSVPVTGAPDGAGPGGVACGLGFGRMEAIAAAGALPDAFKCPLDEAQRHIAALESQNADLARRFAEHSSRVRDEREQSDGVIASAMDAIVTIDGDRRIILFNRAAERMFGSSATTAIGRPLDALIPGACHKLNLLRDGGGNGTNGGGRQPEVWTGLRADGSEFPIEATLSRHNAANGAAIFTAILRDITARVKAEEELRQKQNALVELFSAAPIGLLEVGPDGRILRVNQVELDLLERSESEVLGAPVAGLHLDLASIDTVLEELRRNHSVRNQHVSMRGRNGSLKHLLISANGLWERGRLYYSHWFVRDITDQVKLECEILAIAEHERERIGHDLHEDVCQQLAAIECLNEAVTKEWAAAAPQVVGRAREISAQIRDTIEHARELARSLSPDLRDECDGLTRALEELSERTQRVFGRPCHFECSDSVEINDQALGIHLFRIAQEAVGNALRHTDGTRIDIRLGARDGDLILGVEDNGEARLATPENRHGVALRVMQYRIGVIGGSLAIQRKPTGGTAVICTVKGAVRRSP